MEGKRSRKGRGTRDFGASHRGHRDTEILEHRGELALVGEDTETGEEVGVVGVVGGVGRVGRRRRGRGMWDF